MESTIILPSDPREITDKDLSQIHPFSVSNASTRRGKPLSLVVAMAANRAIGRGGDLLWHLRGDLRYFKELTLGHPVIMGRRTWESLPKGALPGRRNIVLSHDASFVPEGAERVGSLAEAIGLCESGPEPFIIGGATVYAEALPLVTTMYLTLVDDSPADADTFFPAYDASQWVETSRSETFSDVGSPAYRFITLCRRSQ